MRGKPSLLPFGSMSEPEPRLYGEFASVNRRLCEVVRHCGEVRFRDILVRPVICHVVAPAGGESAAEHRHPFTEVTLVEGAGLEYWHGARHVPVASGSVFFMPAMAAHSWRARFPGSVLHGFMLSVQNEGTRETSFSRDIEAIAASCGYGLPGSPELMDAFSAMERHAADGAPGTVAVAAGYMKVALGLIFQGIAKAGERCGVARGVRVPPGPDRYYVQARDYILANLHRNPSLDEVARREGVTSRHLSRLFRERLGMPVGRFMLTMRLDRARHLLAGGGSSVKSVAMECGFHDPAYFVRVFRKRMGATPAAYARTNRV